MDGIVSVEAQRGNEARQIRHGWVGGTDDARGAYLPDVFVAEGEDAEQVMRTVRWSQEAIQD